MFWDAGGASDFLFVLFGDFFSTDGDVALAGCCAPERCGDALRARYRVTWPVMAPVGVARKCEARYRDDRDCLEGHRLGL